MTSTQFKFSAVFLLCFFGELQFSFAQIKLASGFGNHMVLQQRSQVEFEGSVRSEDLEVYTSWNGKTQRVKVDEAGNFVSEIRTPIAGGPYEIRFQTGEEMLVLKDILIGEVWFFSGQSNMEMPMKGFRNQPISGADSILRNANISDLRIFNVVKQVSLEPMTEIGGQWEVSTPEVAKVTSALAYQFASLLQQELGIPVGIIHSSWGGTPIESWMNRKLLEQEFDIKFAQPDTITSKTPSALYNGMIAPLTGQKVRGFIWYQGENNIKDPEAYKELMAAMIRNWRKNWGDPKARLPFYFVEIAPWRYPGTHHATAALFREAQREASLGIPNAGMATTIDIGSNKTIHPPDKTTIAERLSTLALADAYGKKNLHYERPVLDSHKIKGRRILLRFKNGQGLYIKGDISHFEVAGSDRIFHPAEVRVTKKGLEIQSDKVASPVAVRYAYRNYVDGNVYNKYGIPLSSFRTDDWNLTKE